MDQPPFDPTNPTTGPKPSAYEQTHQQFTQAQPPDPDTFLQMIWPILTSHQQDLVRTLLANPPSGAPNTDPEDSMDVSGVNTPAQNPIGGTP